MGKKLKAVALIVVALLVIGGGAYLLRDGTFAVLQPKGTIGQSQKNLLLFGAALSLFVVIPVFALTIFIVTKYRADNTKATYSPEWEHNRSFELVWWLVPIVLISILSVITWKTSHSLDPFKPLNSDKKPLTVQVVALQWKWLFIYPEQNVASVNELRIPINTPINFKVTSDAPMNSFWIPQLGGQIYAMSGMSTQLHLLASEAGEYAGVSANISGKGFSGMHFVAKATAESDFNAWVRDAKQSPERLSVATYDELSQPSENNPITVYSSVDPNLYDTIVMKYMMPEGGEKTHDNGAHD